MSRSNARQFRGLVAGVAIGAVFAHGGCASAPAEDQPESVNTGLGSLAAQDTTQSETPPIPDPSAPTGDEMADLIAQSTLELSNLASPDSGDQPLDSGGTDEPAVRVNITRAAEAAPQVVEAAPEEKPAGDPNAEPTIPDPEPGEVAPPPETMDERIERLTRELVSLLEEQAHEPDATLISSIRAELASSLALLDEDEDEPERGEDAQHLPPHERQVLSASRMLIRGLTDDSVLCDPTDLVKLLERVSEELEASQQLEITDLVLCRRVMGFGRYEPFTLATFAVGQPHRMIVYTEVDHFGHRPAGADGTPSMGSDRWAVDLSQTIQLYHVDDGPFAWGQPEQSVVVTSRRKQRDMFVISDITLPATLSIGRYDLKVVMKDRVTDAQVEKTIRIKILTEAALAQEW